MDSLQQPTQAAMVAQLLELLQAFDSRLGVEELRPKVQALVPIHEILRNLGASLIPREIADSARDRLLHYFRSYPGIVLPREELSVVAAISEWARRVRELRVQFGWPILSGEAAKEMLDEEITHPELAHLLDMKADDYVLMEDRQDRDAAHRWHTAMNIRSRKNISVQNRILEFLQANIGLPVTGEELRYVAGDKTEWARRVRELRTEQGWPVVTRSSGRPDLKVGVYLLESNRQSPAHDRVIPDAVRSEVLRRDRYTCRRCGWNHDEANRSDPRHLELHHIVAHRARGENSAENLITLCTVCHDQWHRIERQGDRAEFSRFLASPRTNE